jgi:formamidopyrimidine-DNA glycosylase
MEMRIEMPALVEVEVVRRDLEKEVLGRRIKDVEIRSGANAMKAVRRHAKRKEFQDLLEGAKVETVGRVGTKILMELDNEHVLVVDLGTGGQLRKTSASDEVVTHTHVVFSFTIGGQMRFIDPAKEGEMFVVPKAEMDALDLGGHMIDPLEQQVAWQTFSEILDKQERTMKSLLMDQTFIVGLGDIYTDEILFESALRYDRMSSKLSSQDVRRLYRALMETLQDAVKARGTSYGEFEFRDLQGDPGQYQLELKVYEREGQSCRRCRQTIVKEQTKEMTSYYCPQCQS